MTASFTTPPPRGGLLVLFRGLPGVGKTTLATAVAAATGLPVFCKDDVRDTLVTLERRLPTPPLLTPPPPPPSGQAERSPPMLPSVAAAAPTTATAVVEAGVGPLPLPPSAAEWNDAAYTILYSMARTQLLTARLPGVLLEAPLVRASAVAAAATAVLGVRAPADPPVPSPLPCPPASGSERLLLVNCTCATGVWEARLAARARNAAQSAAAAVVDSVSMGGSAGEHRPTTVAAVRAYYGDTILESAGGEEAADVLEVDTGRELGELVAEVAAWRGRRPPSYRCV
ncbi:hypothetical protein MMPV_004480 [Pyropia vietnamensis]